MTKLAETMQMRELKEHPYFKNIPILFTVVMWLEGFRPVNLSTTLDKTEIFQQRSFVKASLYFSHLQYDHGHSLM